MLLSVEGVAQTDITINNVNQSFIYRKSSVILNYSPTSGCVANLNIDYTGTGATLSVYPTQPIAPIAIGTYSANFYFTPGSVNESTGDPCTGSGTINFIIAPKALTMTGLSVPSSKVYDGTTNAVVTDAKTLQSPITAGTGFASDGKPFIGDVVSLTGTTVGTYNTKDVATATTVTYTGISLTGTGSGNYTLTTQAPSAATITAKALTITGATTTNKEYDRTNTASVTGGTLVGVILPDVVNLTQSGTFAQVNVGTGITITSTSTIDNANYSLTQPTLTARDITPKTVTINAVASNKQYDGTTTATVNLSSTSFISPDIVTINYASATFDTKEVGNGKTVTINGISLSGADALNYFLPINIATALANITPPPVFIFEVPNAFTPNGDGLNDKLKIISNAGISTLTSFKIFSRSGNLVFESRDLSIGWDGRFKGNMLPSDIYYWTAVYVDRNDQTNSKTGTVLLLK